MAETLPIVRPGKRAIVSGRTGSGKSTLACWLLNRTRQHWVILNPKWTAAYKELPESEVITRFDESKVNQSIDKNRFTIINFDGKTANAEYMDEVISFIHSRYENIGICADELFTLHTGGRPGAGLTSWLTQGRELKQTFIGLTQRPAWISRFCFSEADYIIGMDLSLKEDRKRLHENSGCPYFEGRIEPRKWLFYDVNADSISKYGAVPLLKSQTR